MTQEERTFPTPFEALLWTLVANLLLAVVASTMSQWVDPIAAIGLATALVLGGLCALLSRFIPEPHEERIGLRGIASKYWLPLLLLVPSILLSSEIDNIARSLLPPPDMAAMATRRAERIVTNNWIAGLETFVVVACLVPILEEWFFRGIVQQGMVKRFGSFGGVTATAFLFALAHGSPGISVQAWVVATSATLLSGMLLGWVRICTGSLLATILLHAAYNGVGVVALRLAEHVPIAGFNAPGSHTPAFYLISATISVVIGLTWITRIKILCSSSDH